MRWWLFLPVLLLAACTRTSSQPDASCACPPAAAPAAPSAATTVVKPVRKEPTAAVPHVDPLTPCAAGDKLPLDAARDFYDDGQFEKALSCAAQASALTPNDLLAHTERANALSALGRFDEAKLAYARALAIDPDSLDALLGAAHLYAVALPSTRDHDELGSLYAERGLELALSAQDDDTALQFARYASMALNDIGMSAEAIERADWVLERAPRDPEAAWERATGLFELCRFAEAKKAFETLVNDADRSAHAHYHLGLLLEREGKQKEADAELELATKLKPEDFPPPVAISVADFKAEIAKALASLPPDMKKDLGHIPVEAEEVPATADLLASEPPLSPTILGLFRGPPLGEPCLKEEGPVCRSIALFRKNLMRAVKTRDELNEQIRVTLLHEVGHLRGEDDYELAARGLE